MLSRDNTQAALELSTEFYARSHERSPIFKRMEEVARHYNGDISVPLPELDENEKPAIANLMGMGIDQFAMRVASVMPNLIYPSTHIGFNAADERARSRRLANMGWWKMNDMKRKIRRRARYLTAYGMAPVSISPVSLDPNDHRQIPFWRVRNPLSTFPAPSIDPDNMEPTDCIFVDYRPLGWLKRNYPRQAAVLSTNDESDTDLFTILEYVDEVETVLCVLGKEKIKKERSWETARPTSGLSMQQILKRIPNRMEICPVVIPGRITLDRLQGQFDQMMGMYQRAAKLDALNTIAVFRDVFADEWIVSPANAASTPRVVAEANGMLGERGIIENGQLQVVHVSPGQSTQNAQDNLERNQRLAGGIPQEFGGESGTNIRTARRGSAVLSSEVDMPIQEYQELFADSLEHENLRAVRCQKKYYGPKPSMFFFGMDGKVTSKDYVPNEVFETEISIVKYPVAGADINALTVRIGQKMGLGTLSAETAMEMDPDLDDVATEKARIQIEGVEKALLSAVEQGAVSGNTPMTAVATILQKLKSREPIEDAVLSTDKEMKQQQAQMADQQQAAAAQAANPTQPNPAADPDAQPGIASGPTNAPAPIAPAGQPSLEDLLSSLHQPINTQGNEPAPMTKVGVQ